ncbi:40541_t:CDS:2 [Gigaspora margarita]|uniref:40541_t:CDS:1 n=1 Tax=Gigaspora margarita TaxID=4874 RepID=A0ABN7UIK9_GIGMA|nr:40541_t:CDS:2 [Gigaspora margarita]
MSKYKATLVLRGNLVQDLHFGLYAKNWWISRSIYNNLICTFLYPIRLEALQSNIYRSSSEAITSIYQQAFSTKTRLDGLLVMGYDDLEICEMLLSNIYFHPYTFTIGSLNLTIFRIDPTNDRAMLKQLYKNGYLSTTPENHENVTDQFWNAFQDALDNNVCGIDGKRRILSIIAYKIPYNIIKEKVGAKGNQKFGKKGADKRISKHVIAYLEDYFLLGNTNKSDKYSAEEMRKELIELVKVGNLEESDIPKVSTIQNWIARYAMQHKQKTAQIKIYDSM